MPNRLELVGEWEGVEWINDSKATNVSSTLVAVQGMTRPTVLLLGGRHKGEPYTALADSIAQHVKHVIAFGEAGPIVEHDLANATPLTRIDGSFEEVVATARDHAVSGDAVLLSPACSSYDMFDNYVERGKRFRYLAEHGDE
jgi:UDP-N-acetylmuramoylalanine--D-glutamate ligase